MRSIRVYYLVIFLCATENKAYEGNHNEFQAEEHLAKTETNK